MYGNLYYSLPKANSPTGNGVACVDLRTGKTEWTTTAYNSVSFGQFYDFESPNQHGINPNGYLWITGTVSGVGLVSPGRTATATNASYTSSSTNSTAVVSGSGWIAVDPMTGGLLYNLTSIPSGTRYRGPQGEVLISNIGGGSSSTTYKYIWQWNNTKLPGNDVAGGITQWIPGTTNYNMSQSYDWNVTLSQPLPAGSSVIQVLPGDLVFGTSTNMQYTSSTSSGVFGTPDPYTLWAVNINQSRGTIGQVMWVKDYPAPAGNLTVLIGQRDQQTHVFTTYYRETRQWNGYSLLTGEKLWGPTPSENPWNYYGGTTGLTAPYAIGYGHLYSPGFSGTLYCYDLMTGKTLFTYGNDPNDPYNSTITSEAIYGDYPMQVAAVADGKVYMVPCEHSLDAPPYKGASVRCVNATTGKEIWKMYGMSSWQMQAVADGYYTYLNLNDMRIYCVGPGPSSTTVTASPSVITDGNSILVTGTVTDQSPNTELKGTAAISDADQGVWMEYMLMKNIAAPTNVKGVEVTLDALDPNGNFVHIGTVTSDATGMFKKMYTPEVPGEYTILATFAGSGAYGASYAETAIGVTEAPPPTAPPEYPQPIDYTMDFVYVAIAIIIAIAIVGILLLRKK